MADLKLAPEGLVIPPQYLADLGPDPSVRRIKGGLIIESRDQAMARAQLRELVARLGAAVGTEAPDDDEIAALVDKVRAERARHR
ncbi:hypothetical protein [Thiohalocapsa sp. ML1]|uniref:hypothetical protein n=1 Tax=Thiohalocapsa sp. ML1 TaxID=1431688 RepID=UPI0007322EC7|nr:hypothetical protein [Thiohalocapsa sp. ML1]